MSSKISIVADATFVAPVPIHVPGKGTIDINFTFKHRTTDDLNKWRKEAAEKKLNDVEYVMGCCTGWELDEEWTKKNVGIFFKNYHTAPLEITRVYYEELGGRAKRKN